MLPHVCRFYADTALFSRMRFAFSSRLRRCYVAIAVAADSFELKPAVAAGTAGRRIAQPLQASQPQTSDGSRQAAGRVRHEAGQPAEIAEVARLACSRLASRMPACLRASVAIAADSRSHSHTLSAW